MSIDLTGRVAIVTGAGGGLGRTHAMQLARRGARVVVNDPGGAADGVGSSAAAQAVAEEIAAAGGEAMASDASVTNREQVDAMVAAAVERWGGVHILVNNAGILRDRTFANMALDDFLAVVDVHLMGAVNCTKAVWQTMRDQRYGRVVMTTSSSGLYGNFGQANYGAAKMALVGLMQTLGLEGAKYDIRVNCLAPTAATRMVAGLLPDEMLDLLTPEKVSSAMLALVADGAPTRMVLCAGGGSVEVAHVTLTRGLFVGDGDDAADAILRRMPELVDRAGEIVPGEGPCQGQVELAKAGYRDVAA